MSNLIGSRGELLDFDSVPGDPTYAEQAGRQDKQRAMRWGNRALIALNPDPNTNPNLFGQKGARNSATVLQVSDLGREYPISVQIRFARVNVTTGAAVLPFVDLNWPIGGLADPPVILNFKIRRGVDPLAPVTDDLYRMLPVNTKVDSVPFDVITGRSLGLEVSIEQPGGTPAQNNLCNFWLEAVATVLDDVSARARLPGYFTILNRTFVPAVNASVQLLASMNARAQFIIQNTSTNANLWVNFGFTAVLPPVPDATLVIKPGDYYESPVGGYTGFVFGAWDDPAPNGGALVTEGTRKSLSNP